MRELRTSVKDSTHKIFNIHTRITSLENSETRRDYKLVICRLEKVEKDGERLSREADILNAVVHFTERVLAASTLEEFESIAEEIFLVHFLGRTRKVGNQDKALIYSC